MRGAWEQVAPKALALLVLASLLTACGVPGAVPSRQSVSNAVSA